MRRLLFAALFILCGIVALAARSAVYIKIYPVIINAFFLALFGRTLFGGESMVFKFAILRDKSILQSPYRRRIEAYCRRVTIVWCLFFVANGAVALWTVYSVPSGIWILYNGCLAYILMGFLFAGEFIVRKFVQKSMKKSYIPLTKIKLDSRDMNSIVCYQGRFTDGVYKTWRDFSQDCTKMRRFLASKNVSRWILHCDDCYYFYVTFAALLFSNRDILLVANTTKKFLNEIWQDGIGFLTDQAIEGAVDIAKILDGSILGMDEYPDLDGAATRIFMYTSGSTGKPKAVLQRMKELENDNKFIFSMWGDEIWRRKMCSCISQHHIYGLLFSIMLPFAAGVPFGRNRIVLPAEFESLVDDSYSIVVVPAFLKRALEEYGGGFSLKSPIIFTAGGVLDPELAKKTHDLMGFWPIEVYGSTETSGIAWRQSVDGLEWTPFANSEISQNAAGCLVIKSPCVSDPAGFETADLVEIHSKDKFILKGRADSIVKIEGKRVSVTEVENRLNKSPYVKDSCVVAMSGRRQYLAAAVVLSPDGAERFARMEKYLVNQFFRNYLAEFFEAVVLPRKWRFVDAIPQNAMGKRKKEEISALFDKTPESICGIEFKIIEQRDGKVAVEFAAGGECDFFDGHFPMLKIMPAVAQFHIVATLVRRFFKIDIPNIEARRIKFCSPILPEEIVLLSIEYSGDKISFECTDRNGRVFSKGTFLVRSGE